MSVESVKHFLEKVESDPELLERLHASSIAERAALSIERGAELGFDFTAEELEEVRQIHRFWEHAAEDGELREKLGALESPDTVVAAVVELARGAGFDFSAESLAALMQLQPEQVAEEELSTDELEGVAGGRGRTSFGTISDGSSNTIMMGERLRTVRFSFFQSWLR